MHPTLTSTSKLVRLTRYCLRANIPGAAAGQLKHGLVWRVLTLRPLARFAILSLAVASAAFGLLGPYYQKHFVDGLLSQGGAQASTEQLAVWILLAFVALLFSQGLAAVLRLVCVREGALVNRWLSRALYTHTLRLSHSSRRKHTVGEFVSVYAQDISSSVALIEELLPMTAMSIIPFIAAPLAVSFYFDIPMRWLALVALGSLSLLFAMSFRQSRFFTAFKRLAAERLAVVNEWLQNIRIIRILGWTEAFEAKIFERRAAETVNRLGMVTNGSAMNAYAQAAPGLVAATGIASVVLTYSEVTPGEIFALLWVLSVFLARPIRSIPWNIVIFLDGLTSCRRLEKVFALPTETDGLGPSPVARQGAMSARMLDPETALEVRGLSLVLSGKKVLDSLSFSLRRGEFVAIVGEVGAGKTLLLDALLREAPASFEDYEIAGRDALTMDLESLRSLFAYVPQDGFVMSSTLRDNVAFEYAAAGAGDRSITTSLQLSAFDPGHETLAAGLETEIGERGVNLSGGQRQRVSLGRAHFSKRPIVLLDDCLSAVDVDTERRLLADLIEGAWRDKTRLLVTHRLSVLPRVDRIIVMSKGSFVAEGSFAELMASSELFRQITKSLEPRAEGASS